MKYILPGMGANSDMYSGPWRNIADAGFIDWPRYSGETSISDLAHRLIEEYRISQDDILIGSSLGGMVSLEIADVIHLKKVFLVGSAISASELSSVSRLLMPLACRPVVKISQQLSSSFNGIIYRMYSSADPEFIVSMSRAILNWQGFRGDHQIIARIHGKKDGFIRCPENCRIVDDGGHLISITHAQECVDFISTELAKIGNKETVNMPNPI